MADELVDVCDENNSPTGIQATKNEVHKKGLWHRASHIWIYNSKGELLIQLRSKTIDLFPDMWDISVAGHVSTGEDTVTTALREIREEIDLKINKDDLDFFKIRTFKVRFRNIINNEFDYVYFLKFDGGINKLKLQKEEVQEIKFVPLKKIEQDLKINPEKYAPHGNYWFEVINEIKRKLNL